jgi:hypothetical protein
MELNKYSDHNSRRNATCSASDVVRNGLTEDDLKETQVGIVSMGYEGNPYTLKTTKIKGVWKEI